MSRARHFVYVFGLEGAAPKKIGYSNDPENRRCQVQTGNPFKVCIEQVFSFRDEFDARNFEKACHHKFADRRLEREWFSVSTHEVVEYYSLFLEEKRDQHVADKQAEAARAKARRRGFEEYKKEKSKKILGQLGGLADQYYLSVIGFTTPPTRGELYDHTTRVP